MPGREIIEGRECGRGEPRRLDQVDLRQQGSFRAGILADNALRRASQLSVPRRRP